MTSTRVITTEGMRDAAVIIDNGKITALLDRNRIPSDADVEDVGNLVIMPGLVDTHVHINEPGRTAWEGFETVTKAAAAGGITTLVDMPLNSSPVTTTVEAFRKKLEAAERKLWVDCGFYGGIVPDNTTEVLPLVEAGVLGFKAFLVHSGIDEFPNVTERDLRAVMPRIAKSGLPLLVHCELQPPAIPNSSRQRQDDVRNLNLRSYGSYLASRPPQWEYDAIELMIRLCKEFNCKVHIVHVSSSNTLPMLRDARRAGLPLTTETCPHYLYFAAEEIADGDTRFKCAPPIRDSENRKRLWNELKNDTIDFIVSDHSPSPPEMKNVEEGDFQKAWGGISSLQFGLSIIWSEARMRDCSLEDMTQWMCNRPAKLVGLGKRKGAIAPGYDADLVVWNPEDSFTVDPSMIFHRHKMTPYKGRTLYGKIERTYLRGRKVFENGTHSVVPHGNIILSNQQ